MPSIIITPFPVRQETKEESKIANEKQLSEARNVKRTYNQCDYIFIESMSRCVLEMAHSSVHLPSVTAPITTGQTVTITWSLNGTSYGTS